MPVLYHEVRGEDHILKNGSGEVVFRGPEHDLVTRTYLRPGDRYKTYKNQEAMLLSEFLAHIRDLREPMRLGPPVAIPGQRRAGEKRKRGRSVD